MTVTDPQHEEFGKVATVAGVPSKVNPSDEQRYDLITPDSRHQFAATERQIVATK